MQKIISIYYMEDYKLKAEFINGEVKIYDFSPQLDFPAFRPLKDKKIFSSVSLDHGVPVWLDGEVDIAPEVLYYDGVVCDS
ncbi:MAG: DUF2442 domain-containing protein [Candidatus Fibromonas sp.]|jgi:hypothetical protein|nr:DUF2442 domain-containing protein [Candidatus Fibromonas sp.]